MPPSSTRTRSASTSTGARPTSSFRRSHSTARSPRRSWRSASTSGHRAPGDPKPVKPLEQVPPACGEQPTEGCVQRVFDGLPEVELVRPHLVDVAPSAAHEQRLALRDIDEPAHYVDATTGTVLVRFINDARTRRPGSASTCRSPGTSAHDGHRPRRRPREAVRRIARRGRYRPDRRSRRASSASSARMVPARRRRCASSRRCSPCPPGPPRPPACQ